MFIAMAQVNVSRHKQATQGVLLLPPSKSAAACGPMPLSLTLLMLGVFTNNHYFAFSFYNLAFFTHFFN
jgi:hypothetical protein